MATSRVYSLEDKITQLQNNLDQSDDFSDEDLSALEDQVARVSAQVVQSERQVSRGH